MSQIQLSLAIGEYDHVRDVLDGVVPIDGVDLTVLRLPVEEMFYRFIMHEEFDVSEASFAKMAAFAGLISFDRSWQLGDISSGLVVVRSKRDYVIHRRTFGSRLIS